MANSAERKIKRFHQNGKQITFACAHDSKATTLGITIQTPTGTVMLALDDWQTNDLMKWLQEQNIMIAEEKNKK
jgi:hypothetical protein